ncbi:MAG: dockerin type I repeat-containing protein [Gemmatimonadota bacterium]|nr:MAG: dockerin type I repeat-containing protein [Gemmatimonadota bacterium]
MNRHSSAKFFAVVTLLVTNMVLIVTPMSIWALEKRAAHNESPASYYPLQVGNSWTFSDVEDFTETIVDTQRISQELYFEFDQARHFPGVLFRMSEDRKLMMLTGGAEQVWLDFSAEVGDTWNVAIPGGERWLVHLESTEDTVSVPAGTFTKCHCFWFEFEGADNDWVEWYAPGVGPVKRTLLGFGVIEYPLQRAIIDGVAIPGLKGDVDGNGVLDVSDVMLVVNIILGLLEPKSDRFWVADLNENGVIDILDVVDLVRYILGEEPKMSRRMLK